MVFYQFGTKPLFTPMITSRQPHPRAQTSRKIYWNQPVFIDEIAPKIIDCNFAAILLMSSYSRKSYRGPFTEKDQPNTPPPCIYR